MTIFDDRLMISAIKLRFYQAKQFDASAFAAEFQTNLDDALAQDSGAPILSLSRQPAFPLITIYNVPDGNGRGRVMPASQRRMPSIYAPPTKQTSRCRRSLRRCSG